MSKNPTEQQIEDLEELKKEITEKKTEIDSISKLANDNQEGWYRDKAAETYYLMIRIYEALNRDKIIAKDKEKLQEILKSFNIANKNGLVFDAIHTQQSYHDLNLIINSQKYASDRVLNKNFIPYFNNNEVIISGGHSKHSIIVKYWRQGFDKNDNPVSDDKNPDHYKYYRTEYNAGDSTKKIMYFEKLAMTVSTTEILPYKFNGDTPIAPYEDKLYTDDYYKAMETTIKNLITAEKIVSVSKKPKNAKQYRTISGDAISADIINRGLNDKSEKESIERWVKYRNIRRRLKGEYVSKLSKFGAIQTSGNCTYKSIYNFVKDKIGYLLSYDIREMIEGDKTDALNPNTESAADILLNLLNEKTSQLSNPDKKIDKKPNNLTLGEIINANYYKIKNEKASKGDVVQGIYIASNSSNTVIKKSDDIPKNILELLDKKVEELKLVDDFTINESLKKFLNAQITFLKSIIPDQENLYNVKYYDQLEKDSVKLVEYLCFGQISPLEFAIEVQAKLNAVKKHLNEVDHKKTLEQFNKYFTDNKNAYEAFVREMQNLEDPDSKEYQKEKKEKDVKNAAHAFTNTTVSLNSISQLCNTISELSNDNNSSHLINDIIIKYTYNHSADHHASLIGLLFFYVPDVDNPNKMNLADLPIRLQCFETILLLQEKFIENEIKKNPKLSYEKAKQKFQDLRVGTSTIKDRWDQRVPVFTKLLLNNIQTHINTNGSSNKDIIKELKSRKLVFSQLDLSSLKASTPEAQKILKEITENPKEFTEDEKFSMLKNQLRNQLDSFNKSKTLTIDHIENLHNSITKITSSEINEKLIGELLDIIIKYEHNGKSVINQLFSTASSSDSLENCRSKAFETISYLKEKFIANQIACLDQKPVFLNQEKQAIEKAEQDFKNIVVNGKTIGSRWDEYNLKIEFLNLQDVPLKTLTNLHNAIVEKANKNSLIIYRTLQNANLMSKLYDIVYDDGNTENRLQALETIVYLKEKFIELQTKNSTLAVDSKQAEWDFNNLMVNNKFMGTRWAESIPKFIEHLKPQIPNILKGQNKELIKKCNIIIKHFDIDVKIDKIPNNRPEPNNPEKADDEIPNIPVEPNNPDVIKPINNPEIQPEKPSIPVNPKNPDVIKPINIPKPNTSNTQIIIEDIISYDEVEKIILQPSLHLLKLLKKPGGEKLFDKEIEKLTLNIPDKNNKEFLRLVADKAKEEAKVIPKDENIDNSTKKAIGAFIITAGILLACAIIVANVTNIRRLDNLFGKQASFSKKVAFSILSVLTSATGIGIYKSKRDNRSTIKESDDISNLDSENFFKKIINKIKSEKNKQPSSGRS